MIIEPHKLIKVLNWFLTTAALGVSSGPVAAFDGAYDSTIDRCYRMSDTRVIITGNKIEMWESLCELRNPTAVRDIPGARIFDAACTGEGSRYGYRLMLIGGIPSYGEGYRQLATDLYMVTERGVHPLQRCPPGVGNVMYQ